MSRVIIVTSGKGGVGKTTVTANLGLSLASRGQRVVVVEGDIGLNNLDVVLRSEEKIIYDAGEVALGKATVSQALVRLQENFFLFPATTGAGNLVTTEAFCMIVQELKRSFDYVLIDSPAGLEDNFHRAAAGAEEAILVTTPHVSAVRDAYKTAKALSLYGVHDTYLILNRVRGELVADGTTLSPKEIAATMGLPLCGVLPEDDAINVFGIVDATDKKSAIAYSHGLIAAFLEGEERKIYDCAAGYGGVIGLACRFGGLDRDLDVVGIKRVLRE